MNKNTVDWLDMNKQTADWLDLNKQTADWLNLNKQTSDWFDPSKELNRGEQGNRSIHKYTAVDIIQFSVVHRQVLSSTNRPYYTPCGTFTRQPYFLCTHLLCRSDHSLHEKTTIKISFQ